MTIAHVVLTIVLSAGFALLGIAKITMTPAMLERAEHLGSSPGLYRRIGVLELAAVAGLLLGLAVPLLAALASAGLLALLTGAVVMHLRAGDGPQGYGPAGVFGALVAVNLALTVATW